MTEPPPPSPDVQVATLAGGCFWCLQAALDGEAGVARTTAGYTGGMLRDPEYAEVATKHSGHVEAVRVELVVGDEPYEALLRAYLDAIDVLDASGQGNNRGPQYRPVLFYHTDAQRAVAERALAAEAARLGRERVAVRVRPARRFWDAEEVHQHYYRKNGLDPNPEVPYWMGAFVDE